MVSIYNKNTIELAEYTCALKNLDEMQITFINTIRDLKQEYYSFVIDSNAMKDYLCTHKKIWKQLYPEYEYEPPLEFKKHINKIKINIQSISATIQEKEKEYANFMITYMRDRYYLINQITIHTEGLYSTEFV
jgi:hypothetical protein